MKLDILTISLKFGFVQRLPAIHSSLYHFCLNKYLRKKCDESKVTRYLIKYLCNYAHIIFEKIDIIIAMSRRIDQVQLAKSGAKKIRSKITHYGRLWVSSFILYEVLPCALF